MTETQSEVHKGLAGVVADYTAISKVNPDSNSLLYRGYPVQELAASCSFEQVALLLWNGELPGEAQLAEFTARERAHRALTPTSKFGDKAVGAAGDDLSVSGWAKPKPDGYVDVPPEKVRDLSNQIDLDKLTSQLVDGWNSIRG